MYSSKKAKGYHGEQLAIDHFLQEGFSLVEQNYTIVGGELDVIMKNDQTRLFVEVKVVDSLEVELAVVFIHHHAIYHIYYYEN